MVSIFKSRAIKPGANTSQAEVFNFEDVASRAKDYLESVKLQAQQLVLESQAESMRIRERAQAEGLRNSQQQIEQKAAMLAAKMAEERSHQTTTSVEQFCSELEKATEKWLRQWQHETIALSIAIAEKLLVRQIEADPTVLLDWIHDAVRLVSGQKKITIKLHPIDAEHLSESLSYLISSSGPNAQIQVAEDVEVGRFGVILQTEDTTIDRTIRTQLKRLMDELE